MKGKLKKKYNGILKKYFGYDKLKREQQKIIYNIVEKKKDVLAVLATGFGKSVCYQIPFLLTQKCVIVISPLISLMQDQMKQLKELDIPTCSFSESSWKSSIKGDILKGNYKIIGESNDEIVFEKIIKVSEFDVQNEIKTINFSD